LRVEELYGEDTWHSVGEGYWRGCNFELTRIFPQSTLTVLKSDKLDWLCWTFIARLRTRRTSTRSLSCTTRTAPKTKDSARI
jgi:hypothetical protein